MKKHTLLLSVAIAFTFCNMAQNAMAFDIQFSTKITDSEVQKACLTATAKLETAAPSSTCSGFRASEIITGLESNTYELLGKANDNLKFHDYIEARSGGASKYTLEAMREKLPNKFPSQIWISPPKGRYLDLANLGSLSVNYELVRMDFGVDREFKKYKFYTMGLFSGNEKNATYQIERIGADYHFRYTVKRNGQTLYDGFIESYDTLTTAVTCKDSSGSTERRGCDEGLGEQVKLGNVQGNFSTPYLTASLLTRRDSLFSEMSAYNNSDSRIKPESSAAKMSPQTGQVAARQDLQTYATSFNLIEGGRASFKFKQLPLFVGATSKSSVAIGGSGQATAQFLSDQQYCAQWAKSSKREDRAARSTLGWLAGAAGLGEISNFISVADSAMTMGENLIGEELELANSCMKGRGHAGIKKAMASDAATSQGYVPYSTGQNGPAPSTAYQAVPPNTMQASLPPSVQSGSALAVINGTPFTNATSNLASVKARSGLSSPNVLIVDNQIGVRTSIDRDFGYAVMSASSPLAVGDKVEVPMDTESNAVFTVAKNSGGNIYSILPSNPNDLVTLQIGHPVGK